MPPLEALDHEDPLDQPERPEFLDLLESLEALVSLMSEREERKCSRPTTVCRFYKTEVRLPPAFLERNNILAPLEALLNHFYPFLIYLFSRL